MVWTPSLDVDPGDYTKASDYDTLADNPEYLQVLADVDHDFHVSTGTGKHKTIQFLADSTYNVGSAAVRAATVFTDTLGDSGQALTVGSSSMRVALQPSFLVNNSGTNTNQTGDGTSYTVPWDTEIKDQGGNFASNTFTAAVTAPHTFSVMLTLIGVGAAHTFCQLNIVTSNRTYSKEINPYAGLPGAGANGIGISLSMSDVDMDAADTAYITVTVYNGTKVVGVSAVSTGRFFSGHQQV